MEKILTGYRAKHTMPTDLDDSAVLTRVLEMVEEYNKNFVEGKNQMYKDGIGTVEYPNIHLDITKCGDKKQIDLMVLFPEGTQAGKLDRIKVDTVSNKGLLDQIDSVYDYRKATEEDTKRFIVGIDEGDPKGDYESKVTAMIK